MKTMSALLLVVDDEELVRDMLAEQLTTEHTEVLTAASAREAIQLIEQHRFHVVISDIIMPDGDGIELLLELKRKGDRTPMIAITAQQDIYLQAVKRLGAAYCFRKPLDFEALRNAIQGLLDDPPQNKQDFS